MKGNKPDFHNAMPGEESKQYYDDFLAILRKGYNSENVKGKFLENVGKSTHIYHIFIYFHIFYSPNQLFIVEAASGGELRLF